jgi:hypothetical protein
MAHELTTVAKWAVNTMFTLTKTPWKNTKRTPRDPPKLNLYYPRDGCKFTARIQEKIVWESKRG